MKGKMPAQFERSKADKEAGKKEHGKADMKADAKQAKGKKPARKAAC